MQHTTTSVHVLRVTSPPGTFPPSTSGEATRADSHDTSDEPGVIADLQLPPGRYLLGVSRTDPVAGRALTDDRDYWFSIARRLDVPPSADAEPNDDPVAASPIGGLFQISGDLGGSTDLYRWTLAPSDAERSWRLEARTSLQAPLQLELRSISGEPLATVGLDRDGLARIHDLRLPAGDYILAVGPVAGQAQPYVVRSVSFDDPLADPEPNGSRERAVPMDAATDLAVGRLTRFLAYDVPWSATTMAEAFAGLTIAWDQAMQPELERVSDDRALLAALADWRQFVFLINLFANRGDVDAALAAGSLTISGPFPSLSDPSGYYHTGLSLVARRISDALDGNKRLCNASHDLNALANVWFWAQAGLRYDEQFTQWEDRARGCADLDLPVVNLPTSMTQGGVGSVDLQFAMTFADRTRVPVDVETTLHGARFTFARTGSVDATAVVTAGTTLSGGVFAAGPGPYGLTIQACWTLGGLPRTVCARFQRAFGLGPSPTPAPSLSTSQTGLPDWLRGSYDVNLICENNVYGTGSARVTVSGMTVSLTWSVTLTAPPTTTANCLKALQEGAFPSRGSFTGTGSLIGSSKVDVAISSWEVEPCPGSHAGSTMATFLGARIGIPIGMCVPQGLFGVMGYQAVWVAP